MGSITIDEIVRRALLQNSAPLHYYVPMLSFALRGMKVLHYFSAHKVKATKITLTDNEAALPSDCVDVLAVGSEVGDRVKKIGQEPAMNLREDGNPFDVYQNEYINNAVLDNHLYRYGNFKGGFYGRPINYDSSYRVLEHKGSNGVIRMTNTSELTEIYVLYLADAISTSAANVVHPYAEEPLMAYLAWKWAEWKNEGIYMVRELKRDFDKEAMLFKSRRNKVSITDIRRVVRKGYRVPKS